MTSSLVTDAQTAMKFIMGGKAIFTIVSKRTGKRYTYRFRQNQDGKGGSLRFVDLLSGPDNTSDYTYLGTYWPRDGDLALVAGKKGKWDHPAFTALDWVLIRLHKGRIPATVEFWHEGRCARCGRVLTTPESIESGFGPECVKKVGVA